MKSYSVKALVCVVALLVLTTHSVYCMHAELTTLRIKTDEIFMTTDTRKYTYGSFNAPFGKKFAEGNTSLTNGTLNVLTETDAPVPVEPIPESSTTERVPPNLILTLKRVPPN